MTIGDIQYSLAVDDEGIYSEIAENGIWKSKVNSFYYKKIKFTMVLSLQWRCSFSVERMRKAGTRILLEK